MQSWYVEGSSFWHRNEREIIPITVEEGSSRDWINGRRQEIKVLSSQYMCTKEWVGITHKGMNNTFWCLCHFALVQDVSHALMIMEIETDCESEKKLSQNEYVKWAEKNYHGY